MNLPLTQNNCIEIYWATTKKMLYDIKLTVYSAIMSPEWHVFDYKHRRCLTIGIDPGRNFGITLIHSSGVMEVMHGKLPQDSDYGQYAFAIAEALPFADAVVIEGAAYAKPFGQVLLSAIREGFRLGSMSKGQHRIEVVPPATIRKTVFGGGKVQASDWFLGINHNAADSLSMAILGMTMLAF